MSISIYIQYPLSLLLYLSILGRSGSNRTTPSSSPRKDILFPFYTIYSFYLFVLSADILFSSGLGPRFDPTNYIREKEKKLEELRGRTSTIGTGSMCTTISISSFFINQSSYLPLSFIAVNIYIYDFS